MKNKHTTHTSLLLTRILYTQSEYSTGLSVHVAQRVAGKNFMNIKMFTVKDSTQKWLKILKRAIYICARQRSTKLYKSSKDLLCANWCYTFQLVRIKQPNYLTDFNI